MWELREQLVPLGRLLETETGRKKSVSVVDVATPRRFRHVSWRHRWSDQTSSLRYLFAVCGVGLTLQCRRAAKFTSSFRRAPRCAVAPTPLLGLLDTTGAASYQSVSVNAADSKEITEAARGPDWRLARRRDERQGGRRQRYAMSSAYLFSRINLNCFAIYLFKS